MGYELKQTAVQYFHSANEWLHEHDFRIVLILSLIHVGLAGLACIHTQSSCRTDYQQA